MSLTRVQTISLKTHTPARQSTCWNGTAIADVIVMSHKGTSWIAIIGVTGLWLWSWTAWCQHAPRSGPYQVLTVERVALHDATRDKNIPLKIYYPDAVGQFPVIIFSHGALASKDAYWALGQYWASFGYVSIHPSHGDSIADNGFRGTLRQALSDPHGWENRPKDVSFILDSLAHVENFVPQLAGKLDLRNIGVAGHSFGAYTAALIGGTTILLPGKHGPQSFADPRVTAVVLLSPQGEGIMGLTADSWKNLRIPMLLMYGSRDFGPFGEAPVWRSEAFAKAPPDNKYELEIEGATHMGFTGPSATRGHSDQVFQCVKLETLAFWNAYLKQDPDAREYITSHGLQQFSGDAARFANK
jgi:predicted dienelactone hydrolase